MLKYGLSNVLLSKNSSHLHQQHTYCGTDVIFPINQRRSSETEERDVYEELLTQQEIQGCLDFVNSKE